MTDVVDNATRSRMMAGIRGTNTQPEMRLRKALHRMGFRYRVHGRGLPGKPDLVFPRYRAVVFVHGCYWHRHAGCRFTTTPATNADFWLAKFAGTVERDARKEAALREAGWRIAVVWECALRGRPAEKVAREVGDWLNSESRELVVAGVPPSV